MNNIPSLAQIEPLIRYAGKILVDRFGKELDVTHKGEIDLVTEADHLSEEYLINEIHSLFPDHQIITEERGTIGKNERHIWYLDPLDGTVNYAHGLPIFTISLAYQINNNLILGIVYDPVQDELFSAKKGKGAWLNGERINVSSTGDLINSLLVTGFPYDIHVAEKNNLDNFARFSLLSQGVRRLGSAALDLAYVACGRLDGFWEIRIHPWDIAAGALITQEADGIVTGINGGPDFLCEPQSIIAANPNIHPQMIELLKK